MTVCMNSETVEALHAVTQHLMACNVERDTWIGMHDADKNVDGTMPLALTIAEAEMIFTTRREAIEARLKELGWSRTVRVESQPIPLSERNAT